MMGIKREDVDAGRVDFRDIVGRGRIAPSHPGAILGEEFLKPMGLSIYALAKAIKVPRSRVNEIVRGRRSISAETALRLARYFGTSPEFWVELQARYDLELAKGSVGKRVAAEVSPRAA